mgnify:CR=1 FL=1
MHRGPSGSGETLSRWEGVTSSPHRSEHAWTHPKCGWSPASGVQGDRTGALTIGSLSASSTQIQSFPGAWLDITILSHSPGASPLSMHPMNLDGTSSKFLPLLMSHSSERNRCQQVSCVAAVPAVARLGLEKPDDRMLHTYWMHTNYKYVGSSGFWPHLTTPMAGSSWTSGVAVLLDPALCPMYWSNFPGRFHVRRVLNPIELILSHTPPGPYQWQRLPRLESSLPPCRPPSLYAPDIPGPEPPPPSKL